MDSPDTSQNVIAAPLFPLPNVVLFPRAVLPLHIFEERYKAMTAEAIEGNRLIAMALLRPGWEKDYYGRPPIEPVVCLGRIVAHERLADGKYNFLLQGETRATIMSESTAAEGYRLARLHPVVETSAMEIDLANHRQRLLAIFGGGQFSATGIGRKFAEILAGPAATAEVADLIAFNFLDDVALKQSLLADGDIHRRVGRVVQALESLHPMFVGSAERYKNPGMN